MIAGIGIDICSIERIKKIASDSFINRYFTERERQHFASEGRINYASLAGNFAAKEAFVKMLGTGFISFDLCAIEVCHDSRNRPYYELHGWAKKQAEDGGINSVFLSITHDAGAAAAVAVGER